uniref:Uncharacterized protein LOC107418711 isoform X1 n=1 Tax=Rhizophora mucronata TaxID=61149 RepID=A0A2P2M3Q2_RHIMU
MTKHFLFHKYYRQRKEFKISWQKDQAEKKKKKETKGHRESPPKTS